METNRASQASLGNASDRRAPGGPETIMAPDHACGCLVINVGGTEEEEGSDEVATDSVTPEDQRARRRAERTARPEIMGAAPAPAPAPAPTYFCTKCNRWHEVGEHT